MILENANRMLHEYRALRRTLAPADFLALVGCTLRYAPHLLRTRKLMPIDKAMSRDLRIRFRGRNYILPLSSIDELLASHHDNPTFGNVREMYANDCYLRHFPSQLRARAVLDLGANRGLFSLIALTALGAEVVVGVEPQELYEPIMQLLLDANGYRRSRVIRYNKFIASRSTERGNPDKTISIERICEEQNIPRFNLVKIDVEGAEKDLFSEPEWLSLVDAVTMELHHFAGDLTPIPETLARQGFHSVATDQFGRPCAFDRACFLYASRAEVLA